ncbi:MAG TPA: bi-domain-containing oxidoreductase, partial [Pyrinomonadaceae bacterium]|nr:bi-domain-containing oxidoreductase [Pyrinomonadaceae bacterium]
MKQVIQTFKTGELTVLDVPTPQVKSGGVIIRTCASLVSAGTERMVVNFAEKNLLQKAQARPDLVRQVIDKARNDGILSTLESVRNRMDQPLPLGYSSAGIVVSVGAKVTGLQPGDRVACAGGGYASHAEAAYVPRNLVVKLPDNVSFESACFATIGAIAMQGIRQGEAVLGHKVAVIGLGLLGQLTVQLLRAAGCQVFGIDLNQQRVALALEMGADRVSANDNAPSAAHAFTSGRGFDVVLITADTSSNEPVQLAGQIARSRATIVAVGAVGMEIPRKVFYDKELSFRLSRSYGPGRYDPEYEEKGHDYPYDYVRWTEQRNIEAFVELLGQNKIGVQKLITHRFPIENAAKAYELITGKTGEPFLGVLLTYPEGPELADTIETAAAVLTKEPGPALERVTLGVLGAGNFANATLLPVIKQTDGVDLIGIASGGGLTARTAADKFGFRYCSTAIDKLFHDPEINTVVILTRHNQHAGQVIAALNAGKHVYVEKPLCLTNEELDEIVATYQATTPTRMLMVGFNRRFAPFIVELKDRLNEIQEPLTLNFRVNAGFIPREHWAQDLSQGGGRLLGEGCHFIDLLIFLAASSPKRILCRALPDGGRYSRDNFVVMLEFENGSLATVTYTAGGDKG